MQDSDCRRVQRQCPRLAKFALPDRHNAAAHVEVVAVEADRLRLDQARAGLGLDLGVRFEVVAGAEGLVAGTGDDGDPQVGVGLEGVEGVGVNRFSVEDVVRHPMVERIVRAYDADATKNGRAV